MKKHLLTTTLLAGTLVLASCGASNQSQGNNSFSAPVATAAPYVNIDDAYASVIEEMYPTEYNSMGRSFIIDFAKKACNAIDNGLTLEGLAMLAQQTQVDAGLVGALVGAGIPAYCPWNEGFWNN
jgi:hypothetical protein